MNRFKSKRSSCVKGGAGVKKKLLLPAASFLLMSAFVVKTASFGRLLVNLSSFRITPVELWFGHSQVISKQRYLESFQKNAGQTILCGPCERRLD